MFCAGCGSQIQSGLNYCSRCGRRIADTAGTSGLSWSNPTAIAGQTAGVGFVAYVFVLLVLAKTGAPSGIFVPITFFYFAALFGLCLMFLRQGTSLTKADPTVTPTDHSREPAYLHPVTTAQLEEAREFGIGSVTDATTRTLDEVILKERRG